MSVFPENGGTLFLLKAAAIKHSKTFDLKFGWDGQGFASFPGSKRIRNNLIKWNIDLLKCQFCILKCYLGILKCHLF